VAVIDLPIAREKGTDIPIVPGSSVKGVLRTACEDEDIRKKVFGPETGNASEHAGSAQFTDQRLVCLPVRSLAGVFAWVTSPFMLQRLKRDAETAEIDVSHEIPEVSNEEDCFVLSETILKLPVDGADRIVLEDVICTPQTNEAAKSWAQWLGKHLFEHKEWQKTFAQRFCIVHDDVLGYLLDVGTEVTARICINDEKKTVAHGALWYEESLPAESVLAGLMVIDPVEATEYEVTQTIKEIMAQPLQVGGNTTVGRGLCRMVMVLGGA
jgi:CRISPR-associated protein Cmr4